MSTGPVLTDPDAAWYRRWGEIVHVATLFNTLVFFLCVIFLKDNVAIFDSVWAKDGFCISNASVAYWSSHDLCLYADTFLAAALGYAYYMFREEEGMKPANDMVRPNIFGILAHGLGHGFLASNMRDEKYAETVLESDVPFLVSIYDKPWGTFLSELCSRWWYLLFWVCLLNSSMQQSSKSTIGIISVASWIGGLCSPPSFQFTFVQTVLMFAFSVNQLYMPKEDKGYSFFLYGLLVTFPLTLVGWWEATMCSSAVIHVGGHLCYDAFIPVSGLVFYLAFYYGTPGATKFKEL